jgi:hypothetical protein
LVTEGALIGGGVGNEVSMVSNGWDAADLLFGFKDSF